MCEDPDCEKCDAGVNLCSKCGGLRKVAYEGACIRDVINIINLFLIIKKFQIIII